VRRQAARGFPAAKPARIFEGANRIRRLVIAREILKEIAI
jgi:alkylation response protein AidB-like acyl-CoA dehydrogenase